MIASLVTLGGYLLTSSGGPAKTARAVRVVGWNGFDQTYILGGNTIVEVEGRIGKSVIEISEEGVRFIDSCCPNHFCVRRGWVSRPGDMVACVPNGIVVMVLGKSEYDGITP